MLSVPAWQAISWRRLTFQVRTLPPLVWLICKPICQRLALWARSIIRPAQNQLAVKLSRINSNATALMVRKNGCTIERSRFTSASVVASASLKCWRFASVKLRISVSIVACARFKASLQSVAKLVEGDGVEPASGSAGLASRSFKRSLKGILSGPVFTEQVSFQAPALIRLRIAHGDVVFAGARQVETCRRQGFRHARAVTDFAGLDALDDPVMDQLTSITAPHALDEADGLAGTLRRHRIVPAVLLVQDVTQGVVMLLVAGRCDVETAPAHKLHARRDEMQFEAALMAVADPKHIALVGFETGKGKVFEGVHHLPLLDRGRRVFRREGDDASAIGPLVRAGVDQRAHALGVAAQHLWQRLACKQHDVAALIADRVAVLVVSDNVALDQVVNRSRSAALAVSEELDQHGAPSLAVNVRSVSESARSIATSCAATSIASMGDTWP